MPYITPPVPITLDKPRSLRFDNAAILAAERQFHQHWGDHKRFMAIVRSLLDVARAAPDTTVDALDVSLTDWSILCWAGLHHEDPMSYEAFCALVPLGSLDLGAILTAVIQGLFPQASQTPQQTQEATGETGTLPRNGSGQPIGPEPVSSADSPSRSSGD